MERCVSKVSKTWQFLVRSHLERPRGALFGRAGANWDENRAVVEASGYILTAPGCQKEILVYSKCREFQTGSFIISHLKPR